MATVPVEWESFSGMYIPTHSDNNQSLVSLSFFYFSYTIKKIYVYFLMPFLQKWPCAIDNIFTLLFYFTIYPGNHSILIHKDALVLLLLYSTSLCHPLSTHTVYEHLGHFQYFTNISNVVMKNLMICIFTALWVYLQDGIGETAQSKGKCMVGVFGTGRTEGCTTVFSG